jgi:hypothetical protein
MDIWSGAHLGGHILRKGLCPVAFHPRAGRAVNAQALLPQLDRLGVDQTDEGVDLEEKMRMIRIVREYGISEMRSLPTCSSIIAAASGWTKNLM